LSDLLGRAAERHADVQLSYGGARFTVRVLACQEGVITGDAGRRGILRFRLDSIADARELPSSDPLF